jgi:uncharacterized protein (TIGR03032 family)
VVELPNSASEPSPALKITCSRHFQDWLHSQQVSLAFTTYQSNRLFLIGLKPDGQLSAFNRSFDRPMGLFATDASLYMSTRLHLWQIDGVSINTAGHESFKSYEGYDKIYLPRTGNITGDVNTHDVIVLPSEEIVFVNTLFSCLATIHPQHNFNPIWKPPFISKLVPEDRCHLNGVAVVEGQPRYVTAVSDSDVASNWRQKRDKGGLVMDVQTDEVLIAGLSMPHSPRVYNGKLWLLNSGTGEFGSADLQTGKFEPIAFCPGFVRGLAFHGNFAIVGMSKPRDGRLAGLQLEQNLAARGTVAYCGLMVIDLNAGSIVHWLQLDGEVCELYDVAVLPGVRQAAIIGLEGDEIERLVTFPNAQGIVITKPAVASAKGEQINAPSPMPNSPSPTSSQVKYQMVHNLDVASSCEYDALTFPSIKKRWQTRQLRGDLLGVSASVDGQLVGFAIAEILPEVKAAEIISFLVVPEFRQQKVGTQLLYFLEKGLAENGCRHLEISYQQTQITQLALEPILRRLKWQAPESKFLLCKTTTEKIAQAPWLYKTKLPAGFEIFPWQELTQAEAKQILERKDYPEALSPFGDAGRIEFLNSLGLRYQGEVIGWMITHRVAPDTIRYSSLFVSERFQKLGRALPALTEAIKRQINSAVPYCTFSIAWENEAMRKFCSRRIEPYLTFRSESRHSLKQV